MYLVEESSRNGNKVKRKNSGSVCLPGVSSRPWRCTDTPTSLNGEIFRQVRWSYNPGDLKGKRPKLCALINPQGHTAVQEFESVLETSTQAVVDFQNDRSAVQTPKILNSRDRIQFLSKGCEVDFCWERTGVLEVSEFCTSKTD